MFTLGVQLRPIVLSLWALQAFATGFHPSSVHASFRHVSSRRQAKSTPVEPSRPGEAVPVRLLKNPDEIRGENRYGAINNSTIPSAKEAAVAVGVKPPKGNASKKTWQRAWRMHKRVMPLLHLGDRCKPPDSSLSLAVLWWKALSGNDILSPVADDGLSYDMLPYIQRKIVSRRLRRFFPRLHHANVEIRTSYLDRAVSKVVETMHIGPGGGSRIKVRLISLGAGYDIRSIKLMERKQIDEAIELDLPEVVEAKTKLFTQRLLKRRRSSLAQSDLPTLISVDLNKIDGIDGVRKQLEGIVCNGSAGEIWHNIFVFEGVMIYLDKEVPSALLRTCSDVLNRNGMQGSLCFADRLENVPEGDRKYAEEEMARNGWQLNDWLPKPGLARHMGSASLVAIK